MVKKHVGDEEAMYLLMLHKGKTNTDGKSFSTNCGRVLPRKDAIEGIVKEEYKCSQCFGKEVLCPMLEGYVLATRCKGCSREATCPKTPKKGSGSK